MQKLLFLLGSPRSGKSITNDILASTGEFAWISKLQSSYPNLDSISFFNRKYDMPFLGLKFYLKKKEDGITTPMQSNDFWKAHLKRFEPRRGRDEHSVPLDKRDPPGLKSEDNVSEKEIKEAKNVVKNICMWQGKDYFLSEYAIWARMSFFDTVFSRPKFVHVIRNGKAVAYEYKKMIEKGVYPESEEIEWWTSGWPEEWKEEFEEKYSSLLSFCAFQWKFILKMIWEDAKNISEDRYMEVRYKNLVEKPEETFSKILDFYGLEYNERIQRYLEQKELKNMNYKWREELEEDEKEKLEQIIHEKEYIELLDRKR